MFFYQNLIKKITISNLLYKMKSVDIITWILTKRMLLNVSRVGF